jgi:hypothetical protein
MADEEIPPFNLMCSACFTPCAGADAHVIPRWNADQRSIFTTYRCSNCWLSSLAELREAVTSGDTEVRASFCDFLARHGYKKDSETIRQAPSDLQQTHLLRVIDAVQGGVLVFDP